MRVEELERELRTERPEPEQEFTRRLDDWAAAGFPRDRGLGPQAGRGTSGLERAWERLRAAAPRRVLIPVGAAATLVVVAAVAISQRDTTGTGLGSSSDTAVIDQTESGGSAGAATSGGEGAKAAPPATAEDSGSFRAESAARSLIPLTSQTRSSAGIARGTDKRLIDATAQLSLGAEAGRVQDVANEVIGVTDRHDGVVLDSQVSSDGKGARADFTLEIPFSQLDATLTDLSDLADVISRTEAGHDITARAVRARKDLADVFEQIQKARTDLIQADTREQRLIIKSRLRSLNASADAVRAQLNGVKRKARFATVGVTVTSDRPAAAGDGDWSIGDALDDAGHVLEVIGGIALISLAVIAPLALIATLCWLIVTRTRHRSREQALDS